MPCKLLLMFFCLLTTSLSFANEVNDVEQNIKAVDNFFFQEAENLPKERVIALSKNILASRANYTAQTLGKTFILLADVANNKGDYGKALEFAKDGRSLSGLDNSIKFNLLVKVARGYYLEGKYEQTQSIATRIIITAKSTEMLKYRLIALSYRTVSYALQNERKLALDDLDKVNVLMMANPQYDDYLPLLETLALAHYYLEDYQTSLVMQNRLLTLRFDLEMLANIDQTYLHLARTYFKLNLLDDAYNAFWEAQKYSKDKEASISTAYAELGLARVLLKQKEYQASHDRLLSASVTFNDNSLNKSYLTSLILLAETAQLLGDQALYQHHLQLAELLTKNVKLSKEQSKLLLLLSEMYQQKGDYKNALLMQKNYLEFLVQHSGKVVPAIMVSPAQGGSGNHRLTNNNRRNQNDAQKDKINLLMAVIVLLLVTFVFFVLRQRALRLNRVYDEVEQPLSFLATPSQTKRNYQLNYKMARKYSYPLAVGYLSVINWQELSFHFNGKIMAEVSKTLATLLNESKGEFDETGEINQGEYLLLGPHQTEDEIATKLNSLAAAIKVRFFANLGDTSVKIGYAYGVPSAQDIDPYIFLSRLSEATKT